MCCCILATLRKLCSGTVHNPDSKYQGNSPLLATLDLNIKDNSSWNRNDDDISDDIENAIGIVEASLCPLCKYWPIIRTCAYLIETPLGRQIPWVRSFALQRKCNNGRDSPQNDKHSECEQNHSHSLHLLRGYHSHENEHA